MQRLEAAGPCNGPVNNGSGSGEASIPAGRSMPLSPNRLPSVACVRHLSRDVILNKQKKRLSRVSLRVSWRASW